MTVTATFNLNDNPLVNPPVLPFGVPPLDKIKPEHFIPALDWAIEKATAEIDAITQNEALPSFENTLLAMENAGRDMDRVSSIFGAFSGSAKSPAIAAIEQEFNGKCSKFGSTKITLNEALFARIEAVYNSKPTGLNAEEKVLLEKTYKSFARNGAALKDPVQRDRLKEIKDRLTELSTNYENNVLDSAKEAAIHITDESLLDGVPENTKKAYAGMAKQAGHAEGFVIPMTPPPSAVYEYATNRDFRERVWRVDQTIAAVGTKYDNSQIALETLKLRHEKAQILGFKNHAEYVISDRMAEKPENVTNMLDRQREVYRPKAEEYKAKVDAFAKQDGGITDVKPWDRSFYARKLKEQEFDIDMEEVKAHFPLERVIAGSFAHEEKLFGVKAVENNDRAAYPVFHDDMRTFEIRDSKTNEIKSIFYADYLARPESGKRGGAWMDTFRVGGKRDGQWQIPLIINNLNLTKPEAGKPTLMDHDEVGTLFHEKGHGSHGGLSKVEISSLAGPNVKWDAVEIPSQIQENWANEPEVIKTFAFHHETGAPLPDETIAKLDAMKKFTAGAFGLRQTLIADIDMSMHLVDPSTITDIAAFEDDVRAKYGDTAKRTDGANAISNVLRHVFSGGYSAGYYGYALARVTDADMFEKGFKDTGNLYDPHHAQALKDYYANGAAVHPADLARNYLGRNPDPDAVLRREGMLPPKTTATTATVVPPPTLTV